MSVVFSESSTISDQIRYRKPRTQNQQESQDMDPLSSARSTKPTISSLLLAPFSPTSPTHEDPTTPTVFSTKKKNFATFRGLGCTASPQVSVPAVIRTSADWDPKRVKKKKQNRNNNGKSVNSSAMGCNNAVQSNASSSSSSVPLTLSSSCVTVPDVWCGPGIGLTTDAASVDCVVSRRPVSGRGRTNTVAPPLPTMGHKYSSLKLNEYILPTTRARMVSWPFTSIS